MESETTDNTDGPYIFERRSGVGYGQAHTLILTADGDVLSAVKVVSILNDQQRRIAELEAQELGFIQTLCSQSEEIGRLKADLQQLQNAIYEYMQTTDQRGPKEILIKNFLHAYS